MLITTCRQVPDLLKQSVAAPTRQQHTEFNTPNVNLLMQFESTESCACTHHLRCCSRCSFAEQPRPGLQALCWHCTQHAAGRCRKMHHAHMAMCMRDKRQCQGFVQMHLMTPLQQTTQHTASLQQTTQHTTSLQQQTTATRGYATPCKLKCTEQQWHCFKG